MQSGSMAGIKDDAMPVQGGRAKRRFLIGQLARFGDCLYVTTIAKQIKHDFPDSHVTWAVASAYKSILALNPFVDEIWEVCGDFGEEGWKRFEQEALRRQARGVYDELILTQVITQNWSRFDGTIRSSLLRGYGRPITVSVEPVVRLSECEVENVKCFAEKCDLRSFKHVILFECSPGSAQSSVNVEFALQTAKDIISRHQDTCFVLSTPKAVETCSQQIFDASTLTFRENAELSKYCTLLVGCSSGITWLCTSDWAKKLDTIQLIDEDYGLFAGVAYDHELWNLGSGQILEISDKTKGALADILEETLTDGFSESKKRHHCILRPSLHCFRVVVRQLWIHGQGFGSYKKVFLSALERNKHFCSVSLFGILVWYYLDRFFHTAFRKVFKRKKEAKIGDKRNQHG